jgi:porin
LHPNLISSVANSAISLSAGAKRAARAAGLVGASAEMALEVTYQAQITQWLSVQPDLQYIIHPGGNQDLNNALVLGCRVTVTF